MGEVAAQVDIVSDQGGDVPWVAFTSRDRSMRAVMRFVVEKRRVEFGTNRPATEDPCVLDYPLPAWTLRAHLNKLMREPRFIAAIEAIRMEVPVSDAPAVFEALDVLPALVAAVKDLPQIGDILMVAERQEPALPSGYVGRVRVVEISPYNALVWIDKLDPRSENDGFERALINLSDLKPVKELKAAKPVKVAPSADVSLPVRSQAQPADWQPHTPDLFT